MTASAADIRQAAAILESGGLVAFPTETVYGLGADAENPAAVARVYAAKGRPADHPLIVHVRDADELGGGGRGGAGDALRLPPGPWAGAPGPLGPRRARARGHRARGGEN